MTYYSRQGAADASAWAGFLRPLLAVVPNPPGREDFAARCKAMAFAMPEVPEDLLGGWRQQDVLRRFKFFPSPAEIWEWLSPDICQARQSRALRERLAGTKALPAPPPEPKTTEAIAAVLASVQAFKAERNAATERVIPEEAPKAAYLPEQFLLFQYEREHKAAVLAGSQCVGALAFRIEALRRKLAVAEKEAR